MQVSHLLTLAACVALGCTLTAQTPRTDQAIDGTPGSIEFDPVIASNGNTSVAAFTQNNAVVVVTSNGAGKTWTAPFAISGDATARKDLVEEGITIDGDNVYVAWQDQRAGSLEDLYINVSNDGGATWNGEIRIDDGYTGPLYAEISPRSFSVLARPGLRLNQLRLRRGGATIPDDALRALHDQVRLVDGPAHIDGGLGFSVDLRRGDDGLVGYRAKPHTGLIDLDRIGHYAISDYWEEVRTDTGRIILDPGAFYILVSREAVHVPPDCAAEMAPYLAMVGEFRVHYAGFFDPGFGHAPAGGGGSRGVLEVRCHEAPFALEHGQIVGRLVYEKMAETPDTLYGADLKSNYQGQGLKLSKHFKTG